MEDPITLEPGMIFCTRNPMALGRAINFIQKFWSRDNQSEYSHAGIIKDSYGETFESLWTIRFSDLSRYIGNKILIGKLVGVRPEDIHDSLMQVIRDHCGEVYPFWRLGFHLFPPIAKYISSGAFPVCSELMFKFVKLAGIVRIGRWQGRNPDDAADFIHYDDACDVVFEGILEEGMLQVF